MKTKRKIINILVALSFLATLVLPMATPAFAASDNYASVPKVQNDTDDVTLGTLTIREDEESDGRFLVDDIITVNLPDGVEYSELPNAAADYIGTDDANLTVALVAYSEGSLSFKVTAVDGDADENRVYVYYGKDKDGNTVDSTVDIDSDVTGDIKVEIDAAGTGITSEFVTVGRVVEGNTTTTVSSVKTLPIDGTGNIGTIKIAENAAGVLKANTDFIELVLPNDYEWVVDAGDIAAVGVKAQLEGLNASKDTLRIKVTDVSAGQAGFITVAGAQIATPDDADEGEIEMSVEGNEVTEEDIIVAKAGDFGFTVSVDGDVETIVAGKDDQDIASIVIDDTVADSWVQGRTVKLTLPSWAEWEDVTTDGPLASKSVNEDADELKYTVGSSDGKAELENMTVNIDADAPAGDLVVTISGSQGIEDELVVANIVAPFTVTADTPDVVIGVQDQKLGDITLTESEDGAIEDGTWVVFEAPNGMTFAETPDVEVTDGDIDIDDEDTDDEYFAFRVTGESAKTASTIKISNVTFDVDRTIPVGDVKFDVYMVDEDFDDAKSGLEIDDVNDIADNDEELEEVTNVAVGKVITSAPGEVSNVANFVIGQTTFTLNGVEQTMDVAPYLKSDRTYLPVRFVANACGVADDNIMWNQAEQSVVMIKGDRVVKLVIGSNTMLINGVPFVMDVAPELVDPGRTMLPVRWVAQALSCEVLWDAATQTVTVQ